MDNASKKELEQSLAAARAKAGARRRMDFVPKNRANAPKTAPRATQIRVKTQAPSHPAPTVNTSRVAPPRPKKPQIELKPVTQSEPPRPEPVIIYPQSTPPKPKNPAPRPHQDFKKRPLGAPRPIMARPTPPKSVPSRPNTTTPKRPPRANLSRPIVRTNPQPQRPAPAIRQTTVATEATYAFNDNGISFDESTFGLVEDLTPPTPVQPPIPESVNKPEQKPEKKPLTGFTTPFINLDKIKKRPLSGDVPSDIEKRRKNIYTKAKKTAPAKDNVPTMVVTTPDKKSNLSLVIAIILTVILGAVVGAVAYLAFFQG